MNISHTRTGRFSQATVRPRFVLLAAALAFALATALSLQPAAVLGAEDGPARIVSVGGALTEIVYTLGAGQQLVGVDTTSTYPNAATALSTVGYQRTLSAEGVLSLSPTHLLVTEDAGPPEALELLRGAGLAITTLSGAPTRAALLDNIRSIAAITQRTAEGEALATRLNAQFDAVTNAVTAHLGSTAAKRPRVLFLLNIGQGQILASGHHTKAAAVIDLAGGENAMTAYPGYKPLSPESLATAFPDVLLMSTRGFELAGGLEGLAQMPGLALTPALQAGRVLHFDGLFLLGFGPRQPQAVQSLAAALYPDLAPTALSHAHQ